jgi:hypothetical protein
MFSELQFIELKLKPDKGLRISIRDSNDRKIVPPVISQRHKIPIPLGFLFFFFSAVVSLSFLPIFIRDRGGGGRICIHFSG